MRNLIAAKKNVEWLPEKRTKKAETSAAETIIEASDSPVTGFAANFGGQHQGRLSACLALCRVMFVCCCAGTGWLAISSQGAKPPAINPVGS